MGFFCPALIIQKILLVWVSRRGGRVERMPASQNGFRLQTKTIAFLLASFWRLRTSSFHPELSKTA
jgi:hypothetical protein